MHNVEVILLVLLREDLVGEGEVGREKGLGNLGLENERRVRGIHREKIENRQYTQTNTRAKRQSAWYVLWNDPWRHSAETLRANTYKLRLLDGIPPRLQTSRASIIRHRSCRRCAISLL